MMTMFVFKLVIFVILGCILLEVVYGNINLKDIINPKKWKSVLVWLLKKLLKKLGDDTSYLEVHEIEQYMFRILSCKNCVQNGSCLECGCNTLGKMNNRFETDELGKWGPFMNEIEWEEFKNNNQIKFELHGPIPRT